MHNQTEQFERLTTLLKLKRYEVPPPGYFHRFSGQVIARIEVLSSRQPSWFERFWMSFEARPAMAASCGVVLGSLLVGGFVFTEQDDQHFTSPTGLMGDNALRGRPSGQSSAYSFEPAPPILTPVVSDALAPAFNFNSMPASQTFGHQLW